MKLDIYKYDVVMVDFGKGLGCEQAYVRPAIVVQNNTGNKFSTTTIVVPITTKGGVDKESIKDIPTHLYISSNIVVGFVLAEQIRCIDKCRILSKKGNIKEFGAAIDKVVNIAIAGVRR